MATWLEALKNAAKAVPNKIENNPMGSAYTMAQLAGAINPNNKLASVAGSMAQGIQANRAYQSRKPQTDATSFARSALAGEHQLTPAESEGLTSVTQTPGKNGQSVVTTKTTLPAKPSGQLAPEIKSENSSSFVGDWDAQAGDGKYKTLKFTDRKTGQIIPPNRYNADMIELSSMSPKELAVEQPDSKPSFASMLREERKKTKPEPPAQSLTLAQPKNTVLTAPVSTAGNKYQPADDWILPVGVQSDLNRIDTNAAERSLQRVDKSTEQNRADEYLKLAKNADARNTESAKLSQEAAKLSLSLEKALLPYKLDAAESKKQADALALEMGRFGVDLKSRTHEAEVESILANYALEKKQLALMKSQSKASKFPDISIAEHYKLSKLADAFRQGKHYEVDKKDTNKMKVADGVSVNDIKFFNDASLKYGLPNFFGVETVKVVNSRGAESFKKRVVEYKLNYGPAGSQGREYAFWQPDFKKYVEAHGANSDSMIKILRDMNLIVPVKREADDE